MVLYFFLFGFSSAQNYIKYSINGLPKGKVYLSAVHGSMHDKVDSCVSVNGLIEFKNITNLPVGVYRISFEDSLYTDVILNNDTIVMTNNIKKLQDGIKIIKSEENKIFHAYWQLSTSVNDSIDLIMTTGNKIFETNNHKITPELDSMAHKAFLLSEKRDSITKLLIIKGQGFYVSKLLKAYLSPDWQAYKKNTNAKPYPNKYEFLREHYFDNADFSDSTLLNSELFYVLSTDYLQKYVEPPSDTNFITAINFVLGKAQPYQPVYNYILNLFVNTFSDTEWEITFIYLIDNYLSKNTCSLSDNNKKMTERAGNIKKLKPGNKAPEINLNNTEGKPISLYSIESKVILLMFWSSQCEHCEEVIPEILHFYSVYHPEGMEIFAVSADTDKNSWLKAVSKNGLKWINVSDLKGFQSPVIEAYNAFSTPTFFLLDSEKNIISHPYSSKAMSEGLKKAFGK